MKFLLILLATSLVFGCSQKELITPVEPKITKTIEFSINTAANSSNRDSTSAEIKLSVYKPHFDPYKEEILWDTVIARQELKEFANLPRPIVITKTFKDWDDSRDRIGAGYSISYITKPATFPSWSVFGGLADRGTATFKVPVTL